MHIPQTACFKSLSLNWDHRHLGFSWPLQTIFSDYICNSVSFTFSSISFTPKYKKRYLERVLSVSTSFTFTDKFYIHLSHSNIISIKLEICETKPFLCSHSAWFFTRGNSEELTADQNGHQSGKYVIQWKCILFLLGKSVHNRQSNYSTVLPVWTQKYAKCTVRESLLEANEFTCYSKFMPSRAFCRPARRNTSWHGLKIKCPSVYYWEPKKPEITAVQISKRKEHNMCLQSSLLSRSSSIFQNVPLNSLILR